MKEYISDKIKREQHKKDLSGKLWNIAAVMNEYLVKNGNKYYITDFETWYDTIIESGRARAEVRRSGFSLFKKRLVAKIKIPIRKTHQSGGGYYLPYVITNDKYLDIYDSESYEDLKAFGKDFKFTSLTKHWSE